MRREAPSRASSVSLDGIIFPVIIQKGMLVLFLMAKEVTMPYIRLPSELLTKETLFSIFLDISSGFTKDDFIRLVIEWNQNDTREGNAIPGIAWNGELSVRYGNDSNWLGVETFVPQKIIAVRHERKENDGTAQGTDFVMSFSQMKMAVRVDRDKAAGSSGADAETSVLSFVRMLTDRGCLKDDGALPVTGRPFRIDRQSLGIAEAAIKGDSRCRLPLVYVHAVEDGISPIDAGLLAERLIGSAHVLLPEDGATDAAFRKALPGNAAEDFGIGIFYPDGEPKERFFRMDDAGSGSAIEDEAAKSVIGYGCRRMPAPLFTWYGVKNEIAWDRLGRLGIVLID